MLDAWIGIAWPLRFESETPRGLRETVIMRVGQVTGCRYEWVHHWGQAVAAGVSEDKLVALRDWSRSDLFDLRERALLAYTDAIIADGHVPDEVFSEVAAHFSQTEIVELTLTASVYCHIARFVLALAIEIEPGHSEHLEFM